MTRIEDLGFDWISIWDHFYGADFNGYECHEAVAWHATLACHTSGSGWGRSSTAPATAIPAVLANAITTIDHLSGAGRPRSRRRLGLERVRRLRHPVPVGGDRGWTCSRSRSSVRGLLRQEVTDFAGTHVTLTEARCEPRPVQPELPIWVGGGGEKRTLGSPRVRRRLERAVRQRR